MTADVDSGIADGASLRDFVDAVVDADESSLMAARAKLSAVVGPAGVIDAAAVLSMFQKMTRFADATGIELDAATAMASRTLRSELGVDDFASAQNSAPQGLGQRVASRVMAPFTRTGLSLLARIQRRFAPRVMRRLNADD